MMRMILSVINEVFVNMVFVLKDYVKKYLIFHICCVFGHTKNFEQNDNLFLDKTIIYDFYNWN